MAKLTISPTMLEVLRRMKATNEPLVRHPGGFWITRGTKLSERDVPVWWVNLQTVRAMEKRALLARANVHPEEWRDERRLTDAGTAAVGLLDSGKLSFLKE